MPFSPTSVPAMQSYMLSVSFFPFINFVSLTPFWSFCLPCVPIRSFKKKGGLSTLCLGTYIAILYYYPVRCEHSEKRDDAPPSALRGNTGLV